MNSEVNSKLLLQLINKFLPSVQRTCRSLLGVMLLGLVVCSQNVVADTYTDYPAYAVFVTRMVEKHQFDREALRKLFAQVRKQQSILDAMSRPAEKTKPWNEYRKHFLTRDRIEQGIAFAGRHAATLQRAEQEFGVPAEIIVAIIGVETFYGRNAGSHRVMDALATLAFDYPARSPFFTDELEQFLLLAREQQLDPLAVKGSYAGAMGLGQFIASSYRNFAIDYDKDGVTNIMDNPVDAIGSVANYISSHGWQPTAPVAGQASVKKDYDASIINQSLEPMVTVADLTQKGIVPLVNYPATEPATAMMLQGDHGAEFWVGLRNFYVITRYNHSQMYAMAVYQLSQEIKQGLRRS